MSKKNSPDSPLFSEEPTPSQKKTNKTNWPRIKDFLPTESSPSQQSQSSPSSLQLPIKGYDEEGIVFGPVVTPPPPTDEQLAGFQEAITKARPVVLPAGTGDIQITTGFVYFNPDEPMEMPEPIILSGDEADLRNAIQALEPLMSDADRAKYRDYLDPKMPKSLVKRLREWRKRNAPES